jgi:hypothetical protein
VIRSLLLISAVVIGQNDVEETQPKPELGKQVRELVFQLNDLEFAVRDAAEKKLTEMGPDILNYLPRTSRSTPAEVRQRLGRILRNVESVAAQQAADPTLVTLKGPLPFAEAMAALEKQTTNKVVNITEETGEVEFDFDKALYWEAMDKLLDQASLTVNQFANAPNALSLMARPEEQIERFGKATYAGPFRFQPIRITTVRDLVNPSVQGMRLTINIAWEPRLNPISLSQPFNQIKSLDENGDELVIEAEGQQDVPVQPAMSSVDVEIPFTLPSRDIKHIKSIKGELTAMIPGRSDKFEFKRLRGVTNVDIRRAGVTVTLERVRKAGELYKFYILVRFDESNNALESHRGWILNNPAYIVDSDGNRVEKAGLETTRQGESEIGVSYLFDLEQGLDGCRLVYETAALIIRMPVKYEVKDVELP